MTELIEENEFDEMMPKECLKLPVKEAFAEFVKEHQVIVFHNEDEAELKRIVDKLSELQVEYTKVNLAIRKDFGELLVAQYPDFSTLPTLFVEEKMIGTVEQINEADLQSQIPTKFIKETLEQRLTKLINLHPVMLFMKGNPSEPQCGFSKRLVGILEKYVGSVIPSYGHFDIFSDDEIREGLKKFKNWPTYP